MKGYRTNVIGALVFFLSAYIGYGLYTYAVNSPYRISSEDAKARLRNQQIDLILDVRTDLERSTLGYYPGSVHMQSSDLETRMPLFPNKNLRILVYCNSGQRARMATDTLHSLGYKNAVYISSTYGSLL
jgi:rhodanese-related sulfurtransferase